MGAVLVAVGMVGVIILRSAGIGREHMAGLPANERLDDLAYRFMALELIFETLMLVVSTMWAQDAWDPLETWSFITWLTLAFLLHMRLTLKARLRTGSMMILPVFVLAFLTFFGAPFITTLPHKGAV